MLISNQAFAVSEAENYESAMSAFTQGKNEEAFIYLKNALQESPSHLPSLILLGKVYFNTGNLAAAEELFQESLQLGADLNLVLPMLGSSLILQKKLAPLLALESRYVELSKDGRFEWHLLRGQAYLLEGKAELANTEFNSANELYPNDARAKNTLASFHISQKDYVKAAALVQESLNIAPDNEKTWQLKGDLHYLQGEKLAALQAFTKAFNLDDQDPVILRSMAQVHFSLANYAEAENYIEMVLTQSPNDPTANLIKSWLLSSKGESKAAAELLAALSLNLSTLDPKDQLYVSNSRYAYGVSEFLQGHHESAQAILTSYLEDHPNDNIALKVLAMTFVSAGKSDKAIQLLRQRERQVLSNLDLGLTLVDLYLDDENIFQAEQTIRSLQRKFGESPALLLTQAKLLDLQGKSTDALDVVQRIKTTQESTGFQLLKSKLLLQTGALTEARQLAEAIKTDQETDTDKLHLLAAIDLAEGQLQMAEEKLRKVLNISPQNLSAKFNLARVAQQKGDTSKASAILTDILQSHPRHRSTLFFLTDMALQKNDLKEAEKWLNKVLIYYPEHLKAKEMLLNVHIQQEHWQEASTIASRLRQEDRLNADYLLQQARVFTALRNQQGAQYNLDVLADLWSGSAEKLKFLSTEQLKAGDLSGARVSLERAQSISPDDIDGKVQLARVLLKAGDLTQAKQMVRQLSTLTIAPSPLALLSAEVAVAEKDWPAAIENYRQALETDNQNLAALVGFYQLTRVGQGGEEFRTQVERLLASQAYPNWVTKLLGDSYLDSGALPQAQQHYEKLLTTEEFANHPSVLNNLANIYAQYDLSKAIQTATRALETGGENNPALLDTLGWLHAQNGSYSLALTHLRNAYSMNASNLEVRYHLGYVLAKLNRIDEARSQLQAATRENSYPGYQKAVDLLNSLQ
ncbi:hypothetical protein GCM10027098_35070 [Bowmanella dokdonensis]